MLDVKSSDAGMHLIGWLPKGVDDHRVSQHLAANGILAAPVSRYTNRTLQPGGIILGYTAFNEKQIKGGVKKLEKVMSDYLSRS